jgi:hypothetical protein
MLEIWELITGRLQHKTGKYGGDFLREARPYKGCSATDDDDDDDYFDCHIPVSNVKKRQIPSHAIVSNTKHINISILS